MKFIITESKMEQVIFKYLDNHRFYKKKYSFGYTFWYSKEDFESGGNITINVSYKNKDCFVNSDLVEEVSTFFGLDFESSLNIIGEWVKTKIDYSFDYDVISDYGAD